MMTIVETLGAISFLVAEPAIDACVVVGLGTIYRTAMREVPSMGFR